MTFPVLFSAFLAVVIFGASPVAAKIGLSGMTVADVVLLRTIIGGLIALPIALVMGITLPKTVQQRKLLLISGFCGFIGFPFVFTLGVLFTSANHASMILASLPIFTSAIAMRLDKQRPKLLWWIGCSTALIGEYLLIANFTHSAGKSTITGDILVLTSNLFASIGYVVGGRLQQQGYSAIGTTFWGVSICALTLIPVLFLLTDFPELMAVSMEVWTSILYLAVGVTIVGYMLWYWALGVGGIAKVGLLQFLQPISGVILAWWLLNEQLTLMFLVASCLILLGVWLSIKTK